MTLPRSSFSSRLLDRHLRLDSTLSSQGGRTVFLGQDLTEHRQVVVKVLEPEVFVGLDAQAFVRALEPLKAVRHPNLVSLHDCGEADGSAALNNLATLREGMGRADEAEALLLRGIAIEEEALGPDHPDLAFTLSTLAAVYMSVGRHEEALPLETRALEVRERALGPQHPLLANSLVNLGHIHLVLGNDEEAEASLQRARRVAQVNEDAVSVAQAVRGLGRVYAERGDFDTGERFLLDAVRMHEEALGPGHPEAIEVMGDLEDLYRMAGRTQEADEVAARIRAAEEAAGPGGEGS